MYYNKPNRYYALGNFQVTFSLKKSIFFPLNLYSLEHVSDMNE